MVRVPPALYFSQFFDVFLESEVQDLLGYQYLLDCFKDDWPIK